MTGTSAQVVVALPVHNAAAEVAAALRSAMDQGDRVAVHVFDNASHDATAAIAAGLLPREQVHVAAVNAGAVANFERSLLETDSTYFLWLAHDDRLNPGFVEAARRALEAHPGAAVAMPTVNFTDADGSVVLSKPPMAGLADKSAYRRLVCYADQLRWVEIYGLFRRERLMSVVPLADTYGFDVLLMWRLLLQGPFALAPEAVLSYRTYADKTADSSASGIAAAGRVTVLRRSNAALWRRLWAATGDPRLPAATRSSARLALLTLPLRASGRAHLRADHERAVRSRRTSWSRLRR